MDSHELLVKLNDSIGILNLDMSGKHTYMLSPKSHTILSEIRRYLYEEANTNCTICKINPATVTGATKPTVCKDIVKESTRRK